MAAPSLPVARRPEPRRGRPPAAELGDFTASWRMLLLAGLGVGLGVIGTGLAWLLLRLIGLFTHLFFYGWWATSLVSPAGSDLGPFLVLVPIAGGLVVGLIARFGSEKIRGHGIPEAIEAILIGGSRVQPRVAILKPLSSAIAIGSGGPFGAEGPIILTGGAVGSLVAQFIHLSGAERKTLLVAGAAAGMAATFGTPVAAVLLAVELLLFEWKPRSLIPVALASATAAALRRPLLGQPPLFPVPAHPAALGGETLLACVAVGLLAGGLATLLTTLVYGAEDGFGRLPIAWWWWPAIGGAVVGIGGLIWPGALGVGYNVIGDLLQGRATGREIWGVLLVKTTSWAVALGSGTSGGVLAPLLMIGGALGGLEAHIFPNEGAGFWPLVSMAATLGGTMRAPLTAVVFTLELTHDVNLLLPLLLASVVAHGCTVLVLRRSILTEKISRRGYHLTREYAVDPLEIVFAREVMRPNPLTLPADLPLAKLAERLARTDAWPRQRLYPVLSAAGKLVGVVTRSELDPVLRADPATLGGRRLAALVGQEPVVAYPDEPLRTVADRMATTGLTRLPVVAREDPGRLVGLIALRDVLDGGQRALAEEQRRERVLSLRLAPSRAAWPPLRRRPRRRHPAAVSRADRAA